MENGGIKIGRVIFTPENFDDLSEEIRPKHVRTRKTKNNGLAFCSEWTRLSNMFYSPFVYKDRCYSSSEQCFQEEKARFPIKASYVRRIITTDDPYKCKKLGDEIETNNDWIGAREGIMLDIVYQKFSQNEIIRNELLGTAAASLFEAVTGSSIWSTHVSLYSKATYEETANGPNAFGKILQQVRTRLTPVNAAQQTG